MTRGHDFGNPFRATGTAISTSATASITKGTGTTQIFITDIVASSDVGTATVQIRDAAASIWEVTIAASSAGQPYEHVFGTPIAATGNVTVVIAGASNSLKAVNVSGYAL